MKDKTWWRAVVPVYLLFCCIVLPLQTWRDQTAHNRAITSRRLVLVLDGVPYQTITALRAEGGFQRFHSPARMISTFPSLTNAAMIEILHAEDSPGYEDHYYDRTRNRLLGTIQDRLRGEKFIQGTFRETFDYHAPALKGAFAYVAAPLGAVAVAQVDLASFRQAFRQSNAPVFIAYIGATDSLAHLGGEQPLLAFLRTLDRAVEELIVETERNGGHLEVALLSDHGNRFADYRAVKLNDALKQAGFVTEKSLQHERSVVLPKHGLVGASLLFTAPTQRARVAEVCAQTTGVDFAVYAVDENTLELMGPRGRARVRRVGELYQYEALSGDPLELNCIVEEMKQRGLLDHNGFAAREDWWRATLGHVYVDPLRRLFDGLNKYVKHRADVIVSYEDGYLLGGPMLSAFARMQATHGNLRRGETEGFAMSTRRQLSAAVRGYELRELLELDEGRKAESFFSGQGHCQLGPAWARSLVTVAQSQ
jgi:hypothetical protein